MIRNNILLPECQICHGEIIEDGGVEVFTLDDADFRLILCTSCAVDVQSDVRAAGHLTSNFMLREEGVTRLNDGGADAIEFS